MDLLGDVLDGQWNSLPDVGPGDKPRLDPGGGDRTGKHQAVASLVRGQELPEYLAFPIIDEVLHGQHREAVHEPFGLVTGAGGLDGVIFIL